MSADCSNLYAHLVSHFLSGLEFGISVFMAACEIFVLVLCVLLCLVVILCVAVAAAVVVIVLLHIGRKVKARVKAAAASPWQRIKNVALPLEFLFIEICLAASPQMSVCVPECVCVCVSVVNVAEIAQQMFSLACSLCCGCLAQSRPIGKIFTFDSFSYSQIFTLNSE